MDEHQGREIRYNTRYADWTQYRETLEQETEVIEVGHSPRETIDTVNNLTKAVQRAAGRSMPFKRRRPKAQTWWNSTLTDLKRMAYNARKSYQFARRRNEESARELLEDYGRIRRIYTNAIHATKKESWREFVSEQSQLNTWGVAYKIQAQKIKPGQIISALNTENGHSGSWEETAELMLEKLFPDDNLRGDTDEQTIMRERAPVPPFEPAAEEFDILDMEIAIERMRTSGAPGHDLIEVSMLRHSGPIFRTKLLQLYNNCLKWGIFPNKWKRATVVTLIKGEERDPTDLNSYRPICLLPVLGKLLEKLILLRIGHLLESNTSARQHGFRPGHSTEDAVTELQEYVRTNPHKYVLGLFVDIKGAFDNIWWPYIFERLKAIRCPNNVYRLLVNYSQNRAVVIKDAGIEKVKYITKGCPQGSVLGPKLWNLIMDDNLNDIDGVRGCKTIGYADDQVILIPGDSRREIEGAAHDITSRLEQWANRAKLEISDRKTVKLLLKGSLNENRLPIVRINNRNIGSPPYVKYLGVTLEPRLKMSRHVRDLCTRGMNQFAGLRRLSGLAWGYRNVNLREMYRGLFLAILTYAAAGWIPYINKKDWQRLQSAQRQILIRVLKSYRTAPTDALPVIAGVLPIDLQLRQSAAFFHVRRQQPFQVEGVDIREEDYVDADSPKIIRDRVVSHILDTWNNRWAQCPKGRTTYDFFPKASVGSRWIRPNHFVTQLLTGHGNLRKYLHRFSLVEDADCDCGSGEEETVEHILYRCRRHHVEREALREEVEAAGEIWPPQHNFWVSKEHYEIFHAFATKAMSKRLRV